MLGEEDIHAPQRFMFQMIDPLRCSQSGSSAEIELEGVARGGRGLAAARACCNEHEGVGLACFHQLEGLSFGRSERGHCHSVQVDHGLVIAIVPAAAQRN